MANTVFILGAGASKAAGAPVMAEFIPTMQKLRRLNALSKEDIRCFELVMNARNQLQSVFSKSKLDLDNVEELFGAFEMAALLGRLGALSAEQVTELPSAIVRVIAKTIESTVSFPVNGTGTSYQPSQRVLAPKAYADFALLVRSLLERRESVALISFNYDIALDYALHFHSIPFDYCLDSVGRSGMVPVLKLHGSLNWGRCPQCGMIVPWYLDEYFRNRTWSYDLPSQVNVTICDEHANSIHCGNGKLGPLPAIVAPTWNKGQYHNGLSSVWRNAAMHLAEAENIFIIGYSFPKTDEFFRYFYALGSVGTTIPTRFCLVNPDADGKVRDHFTEILGPAVAGANCFRTIRSTFEESIGAISRDLGIANKGSGVGA